MSNHITVTVELSAEDRARLDRIGDILAGYTQALVELCLDENGARVKCGPATAPQDAPVAEPGEPVNPVEETGAGTPTEPPVGPEAQTESPVKTVSVEELQKAIVVRCAESTDLKAKVRGLVHSYAPSVSQIPEDKRAEVLTKLAEL